MKRLLLAFIVFLTSISFGQRATVVSALAKDANGTVYQNCRYSITFINQSSLPGPSLVQGSVFQTDLAGIACDGFGNLSIPLWANSLISPSPSQWRFDVCDTTGKFCGHLLVTVSPPSGTQDISTPLTPTLPLLPIPGSTYIPPVTTKGDLFTFSTVPTRLGVGTDGFCLTASSGQTTGLLWATCPGGGGGTTPLTTFIPLENCTPDQTGNSFYTVASLTNWFAGHWEFVTNNASFITCMVRIPHPLAVTPNAAIVLEIAANDGTAGHTANFQSCDIAITATASINVAAPTCAANQAYTTTSTAYSRVTLTYLVQSTVAADNLLVVKIATSTSGTQPSNNIFVYPYLKIDQLL
jgi:hypothetical protein